MIDSALPDDLQVAYRARAGTLAVAKGEEVLAKGAEAADVFLVTSGKVQVRLPGSHGRDVILRDLGPGEVFGEMAAIDGLPRSATVSAVEDSGLATMSGEGFIAFLREVPGAGLWMTRLLAARIRNLNDTVFELATLPVAARVQAELLRQASRYEAKGDTVRIASMPTHAELAQRIGSHREAVSRELSQLTREGLVRQTGRALDILSLEGLQASCARFSR